MEGSPFACAEIAEELIVGAIFLDDVDDMLDFVFAGGEGDLIGVALGGVGGGGLRGPGGEIRGDGGEWNAGEGAVGHRRVVGIVGIAVVVFLERRGIGAGAAALGGGDEEIAGGGGDNGRIKFGGNEAEGLELCAGSGVAQIEDGNGIGDGVGREERFFVGRKSEAFRVAATVFLTGKFCGKAEENIPGGGVEDSDFISIGEGDEEF